MANNRYWTHADVYQGVMRIIREMDSRRIERLPLYPIPRGGVPVAYAMHYANPGRFPLVNHPDHAAAFVDDLVDSGHTRTRYQERYPGTPFFALHEKQPGEGWHVFPWETGESNGADDIIIRLLQYIGEDPGRGGLRETPARVLKAWRHWTQGYGVDPATVLKVFEDGAEGVDEMVVVRDLPFYSHCVVGSTFVETPRGRVPISRLADGDWVYTVDPSTMALGLVRCENPRITQRDASLVKVHTDNDTLICTPDHKILLTSGEWVQAQNLRNNDRLVSLYRGFHATPNGEAYPVLMSSRYTRHDNGLVIDGGTRALVEHRFVTGARGQVTHHVDGRLWNNSHENLEVLTVGQHNAAHARTKKLADSPTRKKAAAEASGRADARARRSASIKQAWANMTEEERALRGRAMSDGIRRAGRNHTVFGVEALDYTEDVWCMNVPGTETFFANGIAVHNCEHHLAPFFGTATIAYIPNGKIVGLSKLSRLLLIFAQRLQVQERLTNQVADTLWTELAPKGVGVLIRARHLCMESRGICQQGHTTVTSALRGALHDEPSARAEFLTLAGERR